MRFCRFRWPRVINPCYGMIEEDVVRPLEGSSLGGPLKWGSPREIPLHEVELLAPCEPSKIVAVGQNYRAHAEELGNRVPTEPLIFLKPPSAVIGPGQAIELPPASERVDYEGELAVVIGRRASRLTPEDDPLAYVLGYTCANDVTARDLQKKDVQYTRAKGFDTFCPLGPFIETGISPDNLRLETRLNGKVKQQATTRDLVFPVPFLIRYIAEVMTLLPGDVILTGTPAGVGPLHDGDTVVVEIEKIGALSNPVVAHPRDIPHRTH